MESLSAVLPITGIMLLISIFLVPMELGTMVMFLFGAVMLILGMGFFQLGAEMAMTPIGEGIGVQISKTKKVISVVLIGFIMGAIITVSEPDLQVLAEQVPSVPNTVPILTDAFGVVALVALTPLIAIQIMGLVYKFKADKLKKAMLRYPGLTADSDDIIDFEEEATRQPPFGASACDRKRK